MHATLPKIERQDHAASLVARYFSSVAGELHMGGVPVSELVAKHGSPAFVYDRQAIDRKWESFRNAVPAEFDIYYSVKANPNRTILQCFLGKGCGLEIASAGELHQALDAGCAAERIIFAGPAKTDDELSLALTAGVGEIHVESVREAERIAAAACVLGRRARIAMRVNPDGDAQGGAMRMGGKPTPFGVDEETLDGAFDSVLSHDSLELTGVHLYSGTQILDDDLLQAQYDKAIQLAERVAARTGRPVKTLDFGGGLGIPYFPHEQALDIDRLARVLETTVASVKRRPLLAEARLILEPGRFLIGEAGVYVARVRDIKISRGKRFLILDGGMHHHLAASGNLGQTIKRNFPVALLTKLDAVPEEMVDVVGPLCTPLDVLAQGTALPVAEVGDVFGVFQSGAYARTSSPLGFLSHPSPPEVWVDAGVDYVIRRRGVPEDNLSDQCSIPCCSR